jgi:hypothetical protein
MQPIIDNEIRDELHEILKVEPTRVVHSGRFDLAIDINHEQIETGPDYKYRFWSDFEAALLKAILDMDMDTDIVEYTFGHKVILDDEGMPTGTTTYTFTLVDYLS